MNKPIPDKLYKYQPFDQYTLINLIRQQFYFSKPGNFNDPYDCDPPIKMIKAHRTLKNKKNLYANLRDFAQDKVLFDKEYLSNGIPNGKFEKEYINNPKWIKELIKAKVGVTCFSEQVNNILMWSHYGDKHKGFCLEFDTKNIMEASQEKTYEVNYPKTNKYHKLSILDLLNPELLERLLTTKSREWGYEKEWRIISRIGGDKVFRFNPKALTGIYFGYDMPENYKDVIISVLSSLYVSPNVSNNLAPLPRSAPYPAYINRNQIPLYEMKLDKEKFEVHPIRYKQNLLVTYANLAIGKV